MRTLFLILVAQAAVSADALFPIQEAGKWGLIDAKGKVVVPPRYEQVEEMASGLAGFRENVKWGFLDSAGKTAIPPTLQAHYVPPFCGDALLFALEDGKVRALSRTGSSKTIPDVDRLLGCGEGMTVARKGGKYGFLTGDGFVIEPRFTNALPFADGAAPAQDGAWGLVARDGKWLVPPKFARLGTPGEGLIPFEEKGLWGFIDKKGTVVIPARFPSVSRFGDGRAAFTVLTADKVPRHGFLDRSGNVVIPANYNAVSDFEDGLAMVYDGKAYGYIDPTGRVVVPFELTYARQFHNGLALVRKRDGGGEREMYLNTAGSVVWRSAAKAR